MIRQNGGAIENSVDGVESKFETGMAGECDSGRESRSAVDHEITIARGFSLQFGERVGGLVRISYC